MIALGVYIKGREAFGCLEKEDGSHPSSNAAQTKSAQVDSLNKTTRNKVKVTKACIYIYAFLLPLRGELKSGPK